MKKVVGVFVFFVVCVILFFFAFLFASDAGPSYYSQQYPNNLYQSDPENKYVVSMNDYLSISPDVSIHGYAKYIPGVREFRIGFGSIEWTDGFLRGNAGKNSMYKEQGVAIGLYAAAVQDGFQGKSMEVTWRGRNSRVIARFMMTRNEALNLNLDDWAAVAEFCKKAEQRITYT